MWKTVLRRVLIMIPEIIILSVFVFILAKMMPGDPFTGSITPQTSPARIHELKVQAGLYDPWYVQYGRWITNLFHGDLGISYQFKTPVAGLIASRAGNTLWLSLVIVVLSYLFAIPLGIIAGRFENSKSDRVIQLYNYISYAIPGFVFYLLGLWLFGYVMSRIYHMILPALLAALISTTSTCQYLRSEIIDSKTQDYVKTARAKGVPEKTVFNRHILRNSLLPIAAFAGYSITGLLGGSIFIETVFSYPGMGLLFINSLTNRDYSVITALVLLFGILNLIGTLLSDIILSIVDPRVRIE